MHVTICGHAGLFIETAENRVLVDPILRQTPLASGGVVHTLPRRLDLSRMPAPTLVVVTHAHLDHFDPESLELLARDVPVMAPQDDRMLEHLRRLGFSRVSVVGPWQSFTQGDIVLTATPSEAELDEFGLLIQSQGTTFWHMSDAEAGPEDALQIVREFGPVDLISVKYQPASRVQAQTIRSLGACFDKAEVIRSLETASLCEPRMAFPYASGVRFNGVHDWLNKHGFPFRADEITHFLNRRLAGNGRAVTVVPGDMFSIKNGDVTHVPEAAKFVTHDATAGGEIEWEPIEPNTLMGVADGEIPELLTLLRDFLRGPFAQWVSVQSQPGGILRNFVHFDVKWQLVVHAGKTERLEFTIDFSAPEIAIVERRDPYANFFAHIAGKGLLRNFRGEAGPELLYACGDIRLYEKILSVREGKLWSPPVQGWDLFEHLPEPLSIFLRYRHRWNL
jgi:L-ascorbate metabolism protein UlaG (beta-lactamase superfamily)